MNGSVVRASLALMYRRGSNPLISPAMREGNDEASNFVKGRIPERPALRAAQVVCTSFPRGVTAPDPVITTRFFIACSIRFSWCFVKAGAAVETAFV